MSFFNFKWKEKKKRRFTQQYYKIELKIYMYLSVIESYTPRNKNPKDFFMAAIYLDGLYEIAKCSSYSKNFDLDTPEGIDGVLQKRMECIVEFINTPIEAVA